MPHKPEGLPGLAEHTRLQGDTLEQDGWVITLIYDARYHRTDVVILPADRLSQGPVARLHLKHYIRPAR